MRTKHDGYMPKVFPLLALPAEIRIRIYELALVEEDDSIELTPNLRVPSLLHTSSQIRRETRPIWFDRNEFAIVRAKIGRAHV